MCHYILRVIVTAAILFAIAAAGAGVFVRTYPGTDFFSQQLFWWSLGIACLAVPAASILWKVGTVWMVGVITAVSFAISWYSNQLDHGHRERRRHVFSGYASRASPGTFHCSHRSHGSTWGWLGWHTVP